MGYLVHWMPSYLSNPLIHRPAEFVHSIVPRVQVHLIPFQSQTQVFFLPRFLALPNSSNSSQKKMSVTMSKEELAALLENARRQGSRPSNPDNMDDSYVIPPDDLSRKAKRTGTVPTPSAPVYLPTGPMSSAGVPFPQDAATEAARTPLPKSESDKEEEFLPFIPGQSDHVKVENIQLPRNVADLETWGTAIINYGQKHKGKSYQQAYQDLNYRQWVISRVKMESLSPAVRDFQKYCLLKSFGDIKAPGSQGAQK